MAVDIRTPQRERPDIGAYLRTAAQQEIELLDQRATRFQRTTENPSTGFLQPSTGVQGEVSPLEKSYGVSQEFGNYNPGLYAGKTAGAKHYGLDVATPTGTTVRSPFAGNVKTGEDKDFGRFVEIRTQDGRVMRLSHLNSIDDLVMKLGAAGQMIEAGQPLGQTGQSGYTTGPHLDIMYQQGGKWVDPLSYEPLKRTLGR